MLAEKRSISKSIFDMLQSIGNELDWAALLWYQQAVYDEDGVNLRAKTSSCLGQEERVLQTNQGIHGSSRVNDSLAMGPEE
jgi:hypothetical protein